MRSKRIALVAVLPLVAAAAAAAIATNGQARSAAPSSTILSGTLTDGAGHAVTGTVGVYLPPATSGPETLLASTHATGAFSVRLDPANARAAVEAARSNGGWVNLDVIATTPDGLVYPTFISRRLAGGGWASNDSGPDVAPPGIDVALARGAPGVGVRGSARRLQTSDLCYPVTTKIGDTNAYMVYGELHTGYNESAWFRYGQDADSAVGVGLSYSSPTGPWSVSGSVQIGNARGAYEQWNEGASWGHQLKSNFHYSKYQTLGCGSYWSVKATQWNSGMVLGVDNHANDFKCLSTYSAYSAGYYPNTDFQRSSSNFVNWSGAVSAFGASLTAKSGASTWVIAHWHFGSTYSKYWLCGTDNFPPYAHRIFAGG